VNIEFFQNEGPESWCDLRQCILISWSDH